MKILKIAVLSIAVATGNTAAAEPLPFGCYVTDTERDWFYTETGYYPACYQKPGYSFLTPGNTSPTGLVNAYGDVAASLITAGYEDNVYAIRLENYYKNLEKKLRRACGAKCRRIR
jgi:hypothetical protein